MHMPLDPGVARAPQTRRAFLGAAATAGLLLAGCGGGRKVVTGAKNGIVAGVPSALAGGTPRTGGTFTVGLVGGGTSENLFPGTAALFPDFFRDYSLYNLLFYPNKDMSALEPGLATAAEPNQTGDLWTFHLRDGVEWHDGKPFTAKDVVYNFKALWSNAEANFSASFLKGIVDVKNVRARDKLTVEVPLTRPVGQFPTLLVLFNFGVLPDGATPKSVATNPVGTGPFKYESFKPGSRSVFTRNPNYWENGKPYVDRLVIQSSFQDSDTLTNALLSGQVNLVPGIDAIAARRQVSEKSVQIIQSSFAAQQALICMRVDKGPFSDVRVRQAFRLLCDRQAMINQANAGFGTPGNDLLAPGTKYYAGDLKREHDVDEAKRLLKEAGALNKTFTLKTNTFGAVFQQAATVFAQQAEAAGVRVKVDVAPNETYFAPGSYNRFFGQNLDQPWPSLLTAFRGDLTMDAPFGETHWGHQPGGAAAQQRISDAIAAVDDAKATELWRVVQEEQFKSGGYLGWANIPNIDAAAKNVRGLSTSAGLNFNNFRLQDGWLA
jgi:peptide/nickel transport system substrate-binding protein